MGSILDQLQAILESLQSSSHLEDTFSDPVIFFRQLHMVFSRARTDQSHRGLHLLIEVIQNVAAVRTGSKIQLCEPINN